MSYYLFQPVPIKMDTDKVMDKAGSIIFHCPGGFGYVAFHHRGKEHVGKFFLPNLIMNSRPVHPAAFASWPPHQMPNVFFRAYACSPDQLNEPFDLRRRFNARWRVTVIWIGPKPQPHLLDRIAYVPEHMRVRNAATVSRAPQLNPQPMPMPEPTKAIPESDSGAMTFQGTVSKVTEMKAQLIKTNCQGISPSKPVVFSLWNAFVDGVCLGKYRSSLVGVILPGQIVNFSLVSMVSNDVGEYKASRAWIGREPSNEVTNGIEAKVTVLERPDSKEGTRRGIVTTRDGEKVFFERSNVFVADNVMEKADLSYVMEIGTEVKVCVSDLNIENDYASEQGAKKMALTLWLGGFDPPWDYKPDISEITDKKEVLVDDNGDNDDAVNLDNADQNSSEREKKMAQLVDFLNQIKLNSIDFHDLVKGRLPVKSKFLEEKRDKGSIIGKVSEFLWTPKGSNGLIVGIHKGTYRGEYALVPRETIFFYDHLLARADMSDFFQVGDEIVLETIEGTNEDSKGYKLKATKARTLSGNGGKINEAYSDDFKGWLVRFDLDYDTFSRHVNGNTEGLEPRWPARGLQAEGNFIHVFNGLDDVKDGTYGLVEVKDCRKESYKGRYALVHRRSCFLTDMSLRNADLNYLMHDIKEPFKIEVRPAYSREIKLIAKDIGMMANVKNLLLVTYLGTWANAPKSGTGLRDRVCCPEKDSVSLKAKQWANSNSLLTSKNLIPYFLGESQVLTFKRLNEKMKNTDLVPALEQLIYRWKKGASCRVPTLKIYKAKLDFMVKPERGEATTTAFLKVRTSGAKTVRVRLDRSKLLVWGFPMANVDLMAVIRPSDTIFVEATSVKAMVEGGEDENRHRLVVKQATIGLLPGEPLKKCHLESYGFHLWLSYHKMVMKDLVDLLDGKSEPLLFFPYGGTKVKCFVKEFIRPPGGVSDEKAELAVVEAMGEGATPGKSVMILENDDVFLEKFRMGRVPLPKYLKIGDVIDVQERILVKADKERIVRRRGGHDFGLPKSIAHIASAAGKPPINPEEVRFIHKATENVNDLRRILTVRGHDFQNVMQAAILDSNSSQSQGQESSQKAPGSASSKPSQETQPTPLFSPQISGTQLRPPPVAVQQAQAMHHPPPSVSNVRPAGFNQLPVPAQPKTAPAGPVLPSDISSLIHNVLKCTSLNDLRIDSLLAFSATQRETAKKIHAILGRALLKIGHPARAEKATETDEMAAAAASLPMPKPCVDPNLPQPRQPAVSSTTPGLPPPRPARLDSPGYRERDRSYERSSDWRSVSPERDARDRDLRAHRRPADEPVQKKNRWDQRQSSERSSRHEQEMMLMERERRIEEDQRRLFEQERLLEEERNREMEERSLSRERGRDKEKRYGEGRVREERSWEASEGSRRRNVDEEFDKFEKFDDFSRAEKSDGRSKDRKSSREKSKSKEKSKKRRKRSRSSSRSSRSSSSYSSESSDSEDEKRRRRKKREKEERAKQTKGQKKKAKKDKSPEVRDITKDDEEEDPMAMLMKLPLPVMTREPATQQDVIEVTDMDVALTPPPKGSSGTIPGFGEFASLPAPVRASGNSIFTPSGASNELDTIPISIPRNSSDTRRSSERVSESYRSDNRDSPEIEIVKQSAPQRKPTNIIDFEFPDIQPTPSTSRREDRSKDVRLPPPPPVSILKKPSTTAAPKVPYGWLGMDQRDNQPSGHDFAAPAPPAISRPQMSWEVRPEEKKLGSLPSQTPFSRRAQSSNPEAPLGLPPAPPPPAMMSRAAPPPPKLSAGRKQSLWDEEDDFMGRERRDRKKSDSNAFDYDFG